MDQQISTAAIIPAQLDLEEQPLRRLRSLALWTEGRLPEPLKPLAASALAEANKQLEPAGREQFQIQLSACLALNAGVGMTDSDRREWLQVAWGTLRELPADLLKRGCDVARRYADHPSKIVPTIMREIEAPLAERKRTVGRIRELLKSSEPYPWERTEAQVEPCTPEQAAKIMDEVGLTRQAQATVRRHLGPPRNPTVEDYVEMGLTRQAAEEAVAYRIEVAEKNAKFIQDLKA